MPNIIYEQIIFIESTELVNTQNPKSRKRMSILRALIAVWLMSAKPLNCCQEKWKPDLRKDFLEHHKICIIILWNWNERLFDAILRSYLLIPWHCRNEGYVWFLITKGSISFNRDCYLVDNVIISSTWHRLWHISI